MIPIPRFYYQAIPSRAETEKIFRSTTVPFGTFWDGCRYQQLYSASEFTVVPPGGIFITHIYLRPGCGGAQGTAITNMVVRLSTTSRRADNLSLIFDENLGEDVLNVDSSTFHSVNGNLPSRFCDVPTDPGAMRWWPTIHLSTPFFYNPAKGNLLLDLTIPAHTPSSDPDFVRFPVRLEALPDAGDAMASLVADSPTADRADAISRTALVSRLWCAPFPKLSVTPAANSVFISWPGEPSPARLQFRDSTDPTAAWADFNGPGIVKGFPRSQLELPRSSLTQRRYYRLFWDSPQVGLPDTTVEVGPELLATPPNP